MKQYIYIFAYLVAIVAANLLVATFGPSIIIFNAFIFIGLDLTTRDQLHEIWHGRWLLPKMTVLIAVGGLLSYILNAGAGQIALASTVAFIVASTLDGLTYVILGRRERLVRINGSNIIGAAADSIIFPTLAFGILLPEIVIGQFIAKVAGGFFWSILLPRIRR